MWDYTDSVRDHFLHPRNVGEVENPDGVGEVGNIKCGDALKLTFKLDSDKRIFDVKFKTFGCGSAIAASSILTEMVKGKTLEEAAKITNKEIAAALGGLPPAKMHCSVMGQEALQKAIDYYNYKAHPTLVQEKRGHIVCSCFNVTDIDIENAIVRNNLKTVEEVTNFTKAGGGCGGCVPEIEEILNRVVASLAQNKKKTASQMTNLERIDRVKALLTQEVKPFLQKDGGDCELIDIQGEKVLIRFSGHCAGCAFSYMTQYEFIEKLLKEKVHPDLRVEVVSGE